MSDPRRFTVPIPRAKRNESREAGRPYVAVGIFTPCEGGETRSEFKSLVDDAVAEKVWALLTSSSAEGRS